MNDAIYCADDVHHNCSSLQQEYGELSSHWRDDKQREFTSQYWNNINEDMEALCSLAEQLAQAVEKSARFT